MGGTTMWVRQAFAELGHDASLQQITEFILTRDPTVPGNSISLAVRKLRRPHTVQKPDDIDCTSRQRAFDFDQS
jgi:hypothetical protein